MDPSLDARETADVAERRVRFRKVFEREFDYVWLSLRRLGVDERDLEDVAQDVFVQLYGRLDEYDASRPMRPWLFGFAFRCASDWRRLARHRIKLVGEVVEVVSTARPADESLALEEDLRLLLRALERVRLERRAVLILYELDEIPMKEIAASLGIPLFTAYSRLRVAREELTSAIARLRAQEGKP
jgi:RNA polymerase sigma-70 factor, ECF subfamily